MTRTGAIAALIGGSLLGGCGTVGAFHRYLGHGNPDWYFVYGGTQMNLASLGSGGVPVTPNSDVLVEVPFPLSAVDLPISFAADTALLPATLSIRAFSAPAPPPDPAQEPVPAPTPP